MMSTCVSSWDEVVLGGEEVYDPAKPTRTVRKTLGSTTYEGRHAPIGFKPEYIDGIFGRFPISCIAVINDPDEGKHVPNMERAQRSDLPVFLEEE